MCAPFDYAGYTTTRAPVKAKKKPDISFFHTYALCLSLDLSLTSLLARSFFTHNMCAVFDYVGYAAARAPVEEKKKADISSFHTYAGFGS